MIYNWQNQKFAIRNFKNDKIYFLTNKEFKLLKKKDKKLIEKLASLDIISKNFKFSEKYIDNPCIKQARWSITGNCNFKCRHCFVEKYNKKDNDMPLEDCLEIIEELEKCGVMSVALTGGEPLIRKDILDIIDALIQKNIKIVEISTNGSLLTEEFLDELILRKLNPEFSISFDGLGTHDWLRNTRGAEEKAIKALKLLNEKNFNINAVICLHKKNIENLEKTINFLIDFNVKKIFVNQIMDSGNWIKQKENILEIKNLYKAYLNYIPKYLKASSPVTLLLGKFFFCEKGSKNFSIPPKKHCKKNEAVCSHAKEVIYITSKGELLPCMPLAGIDIKMKKTFLNKEISLKDALLNSSYSRVINTKLNELFKKNPKCNKCKKKFVCGGGCRAYAASKNGNFMDCDEDMCTFFKGEYDKKIQNISKI